MEELKNNSAPPIQMDQNNDNFFLFDSTILNQNKINEFNQNDNQYQIYNKDNKQNIININNINNRNNKLFNNYDINEKFMTRISIKTKELEELDKKYLIELIQFIIYSCNLTLEDYRYIDSTYSIFRIEKSLNRNGYDIVINRYGNNEYKIQNDNSIEDKKEENTDGQNIDNDKENNEENNENNNEKYKENSDVNSDKERVDEKKEEKEKIIEHKIKGSYFCALHNNRKFKNIEAYFNHCQSKHKLFICQECKREFQNFNNFKNHFYEKNDNKNNININNLNNENLPINDDLE